MIQIGSDFSGVGALRQALMRLKIKYKTVFACEKDLFARESYMANYGEPVYYPFDVYDRKIPKESLDIYMTTPPCQAFSLAGKRKGETDKRGVLFYNSHEFIQVNKPRYFIFENVKGLLSDDKREKKSKVGHTFQIWLDMLGGKSVNGNPVIFPREDAVPYHIYWKVLNAKHYGVPQNRERVFIVGVRDDADNTFHWPKPFPLVKRLKDVLEKEVEKKYYLSDNMINGFIKAENKHKQKVNGFSFDTSSLENPAKAITTKAGSRITDNFIKEGYINKDTQASQVISEDGVSKNLCAGTHGYAQGYVKITSATKKGYEVATENDSINLSHLARKTRRGRVGKEVAQTLDTACNQGVLVGAIRGRNFKNPKSREKGLPTEQLLELNVNGTSNALTTVQKENVVVYGNLRGGKWDKNYEQSGRVYDPQGISATIHTMGGGNQKPKVIQDFKIRRLTPRECFRIMDFPDTFKFVCSNTQLYKQAGNSIVVNVLAEIINRLRL
jgi:DNA (cytosine-5)-methyltransferase 1